MKFDIIASDIESTFPGCGFSVSDSNADIHLSKIGLHGDHLGSCIYLVEELPDLAANPSDESISLICPAKYGDSEYAMKYNLILVPSNDLMIPVFNRIQDMLAKENEVSSLARYALTNNASLQEIVNRITAILGNPVVVADAGHKILAMSDIELDDSAWNRFRSMGFLPYNHETIDQFNYFFDSIKRGRRVIMEDGRHKKNFVLRAALMSGKTVIGQIIVHSYFREFIKADIDTMETVSGLVSMVMVRRSFVRPDMYTVSDYMISELVRGTLANEEDIYNWLKFMDWKLKKYLYLIIVRWDSSVDNIDDLDARAAAIREILPQGLGTIVDGDLVVLFSLESEADEKRGLLDLLEGKLIEKEAYAILSPGFFSLSQVNDQYTKAKAILDIELLTGDRKRLYRAEDGMLELMFHITGKEHDLMDFCHPLIRKLQDYDSQNNTDFIKYLKAYIGSGRSFIRAAERLYTHRNTVRYRIGRIGEILNADLQEEKILFNFELSLYLLDYIECIKGDNKKNSHSI